MAPWLAERLWEPHGEPGRRIGDSGSPRVPEGASTLAWRPSCCAPSSCRKSEHQAGGPGSASHLDQSTHGDRSAGAGPADADLSTTERSSALTVLAVASLQSHGRPPAGAGRSPSGSLLIAHPDQFRVAPVAIVVASHVQPSCRSRERRRRRWSAAAAKLASITAGAS